MNLDSAVLRRLYDAFNTRDVDTVLDNLHPEVVWPNGWEGGYVVGHQAVRDYWARQWAEVDSTATPREFESLPDGRIRVVVHVRGTGRDGAVVWDNIVTHTYSFESGKIRSMEIGSAG